VEYDAKRVDAEYDFDILISQYRFEMSFPI
jgi:hypothetical protein